MSGRVYFLGDNHFKHEKIWRGRGFNSMEEHDVAVALSIFETCGRDDSLYLLGDISFGGAVAFHQAMMTAWRLHRRKVGGPAPAEVDRPKFSINVVQGNHDKSNMLRDLVSCGWITNFHSLREFRVGGQKVVATHVPIHPDCLDRWGINVHGHLHAHSINDHRYKCVSWEHHKKPVWIEDLIKPRDIV